MGAADLPLPSKAGAQAGGLDPQADERRFEALGAQLMLRLSAAIRTAKTHDVSNQAFQRQLHELMATIQ